MNTIHKAEPSLLSTTSLFVDYRGMLNQCLLLVVISTGRIVLENIQTFGIQIHFVMLKALLNPLCISTFVVSVILSIITFIVERGGPFSYHVKLFVHSCTFTSLLILPVFEITQLTNLGYSVHPFAAVWILTFHIIVFLKLFSFCLRPKRENSDWKILAAQLTYFLLAPTLIFQYEYPRNSRIRWLFVLRRCVEILFLGTLLILVNERWISPIIDDNPIFMGDVVTQPVMVVLKLMKLALPNHVAWIMFFYWYFHSFLNLMAELLKFADRQFYLDWWNAGSPSEFWRKWNVPVHRFAHLHVYSPLRRILGSKFIASFLVFLMSALAHEYVASVALRVPGAYMFLGMMVQPLLEYAMGRFIPSKNKEDSRRKWIGNMFLWIGVVFGQPITAMMYVNDYHLYHQTQNVSVVSK